MTTWTAEQYLKETYHPDFFFSGLDIKEKIEGRYGPFTSQSHPQFQHASAAKLAASNNIAFGFIDDPTFADRKVRPIDLKPYIELFPPWKERALTLHIHKLLVRPMHAILQEMIAAGIAKRYPIYYFGGWCTRYKNSTSTPPEFYKSILAKQYGGWEKARQDLLANLDQIKATIGRYADPINPAFAKTGDPNTTLMLMDLWKGRLRSEIVSNHAYGTAVDINPVTNNLKSKQCDMPPEIVAIFEKHGFSWGGRYLDAMHFEYTWKAAPAGLDDFAGPVSGGEYEPPSKVYLRNESNASGYFPLGLFGNIHPGIHLDPGSTAEVRASLPGVVVAARLCKPGSFPTGDAMRAFAGGHLGMVVVRHTADIPAKKKEEAPQKISWYAVYQHLIPPKFDINQDDPWLKVGWYREFLLAQHGSAVVVDPDSPDVLGSVWLASPFPALQGDDTDTKLTVKGFPSHAFEKREINPYSVVGPSEEEGSLLLSQLVPRGTSAEIQRALERFKAGQLVTFPRPFLSFRAGDTIGVVETSSSSHEADDIPDAKDPEKVQSYLHWEWFSPTEATPSGLQKLIDLGKEDLTKNLAPAIDRSNAKSLLLSKEDLLSFLKPYLPTEEQAGFEKTLTDAGINYAETARDYVEQKSSFSGSMAEFVKSHPDATLLVQPKELNQLNAYPALIELDGSQFIDFPPPPLSIQIIFLGAKEQALPNDWGACTWTIARNPGKEKAALLIPAEAHKLQLSSKGMVFRAMDLSTEEEATQSQAHFQDLVGRRWRGAHICAKSEWSTDGLKALLEELTKRVKELETLKKTPESEITKKIAVLDFKSLSPLAWYGRIADTADPASECAVLPTPDPNAPTSIFGTGPGQLPAAALLQMNPVTGLWLATLLAYKGRIQLGTPDTFRMTDVAEPIFWSFLGDGKRLATRRSLVAVSKSDKTEIDEPAQFQLECIEGKSKGRKMVIGGFWTKGVAFQELACLLWGGWKVSMLDKTGTPITTTSQGKPLLELHPQKPLVGGPADFLEIKAQGGVPTGQAKIRYHFHSHAPMKMRAFLHLLVGVGEEPLKPSGIAIPLQGTCPATSFDHRLDVEPFGASVDWEKESQAISLWLLTPSQAKARADALAAKKPWSPPSAEAPKKKDPKGAKGAKSEKNAPPEAPAVEEPIVAKTPFPNTLSASELAEAIRSGCAVMGKGSQPEDFQIASGLLWGLEILQDVCSTAGHGSPSITEIRTKTDPDKVSQGVLLQLATEEVAQWVETWCTQQGWNSIYFPQRRGSQLALSIVVSNNQSGTWSCTFSLAVALGNLMKAHGFSAAAGSPQRLRVGYQLVLPNGLDPVEIDVKESDITALDTQESLEHTSLQDDIPEGGEPQASSSAPASSGDSLLGTAVQQGVPGAQETRNALGSISKGFSTAGRALDRAGAAVSEARSFLGSDAPKGTPIKDEDWNCSVVAFDWNAMESAYKGDWIVAEIPQTNVVEPMALCEPTVSLTTRANPKSKKLPPIPCLILGLEVKGGEKKAWQAALPRLKMMVDGKPDDFKTPKSKKNATALTQKTVDIPSEWWGKTIQVIGYAYTPQQTWRGNTFQIAENVKTFPLKPEITGFNASWTGNKIAINCTTVFVPAGSECKLRIDFDDGTQYEQSTSIESMVVTPTNPNTSSAKIVISVTHPSIPSTFWIRMSESIAKSTE